MTKITGLLDLESSSIPTKWITRKGLPVLSIPLTKNKSQFIFSYAAMVFQMFIRHQTFNRNPRRTSLQVPGKQRWPQGPGRSGSHEIRTIDVPNISKPWNRVGNKSDKPRM